MNKDYELVRQSIAMFAALAQEFAEGNRRMDEAGVRYEFGRHLFLLENGEAAFTELRHAAHLFQKEGVPQLAAQALLGCAHALTIQNRHEDSLEWFDKAIEQFGCCEYKPGEVEARAGRLEALQDLERWDETDDSLKIIKAANHDPHLQLYRLVALRYQARAKVAQKNFEGAISPATEAVALASALGDCELEASLRLALAHNLRLLKRYPQAAHEYERVVALTGDLPTLAELYLQALEGLEVVSRG